MWRSTRSTCRSSRPARKCASGSIATRRRNCLSSPVERSGTGEGDHPWRAQRAKDGGGGAGLDETFLVKEKRRDRCPFHHLASQDGPPPPLSRGRMKMEQDIAAQNRC